MASAAAPRLDRFPPARQGAAALADLVDEAERVVAGTDAARQRRALRDVTELLVARSGRLSPPQVSAFDEVMTVLAEGAGAESRGRLARRVSGLPRPPHKLARQLACDPDPGVAVPVLASCATLPDEVLLRVARTSGQAHLAAIARRERVAARVADILADRGDQAVMATLLGNRGAQLSLAALAVLAQRVEDRSAFAAALEARGTLPPHQRAAFLQARPSGPPAPPRRAAEAVALRVRLGLEEADLRHWLANGRVTEALLGLAHLAGCPAARAQAAHRSAGLRALALIVRAADLRLSTLGAYLRARPGPLLTPEAAGEAVRHFRAVTVAQARDLVAERPKAVMNPVSERDPSDVILFGDPVEAPRRSEAAAGRLPVAHHPVARLGAARVL
ncbi:DUF2336 domain-containing protein [Methylobacterium nonmethylotrophicum]|uniref:DUF2336 domain-containing protein n=1 Tax=Methylobacterium nonmethylotrophicum TaxID=1141884 RepID=A0A4Z0NY33_9HYPH|nr:DUF2336 domain-containing protein [Methylobacterium nonmethylotrophicum]TGE02386.1 DUF2336 domain-containing protein [Methylobacterium nonmethylotrophicum]